MREKLKDALLWILFIAVLLIIPVSLMVAEPKSSIDYIKDHRCIRDENTPAVGTGYSVKELYICDEGPRGRRYWVRQ